MKISKTLRTMAAHLAADAGQLVELAERTRRDVEALAAEASALPRGRRVLDAAADQVLVDTVLERIDAAGRRVENPRQTIVIKFDCQACGARLVVDFQVGTFRADCPECGICWAVEMAFAPRGGKGGPVRHIRSVTFAPRRKK